LGGAKAPEAIAKHWYLPASADAAAFGALIFMQRKKNKSLEAALGTAQTNTPAFHAGWVRLKERVPKTFLHKFFRASSTYSFHVLDAAYQNRAKKFGLHSQAHIGRQNQIAEGARHTEALMLNAPSKEHSVITDEVLDTWLPMGLPEYDPRSLGVRDFPLDSGAYAFGFSMKDVSVVPIQVCQQSANVDEEEFLSGIGMHDDLLDVALRIPDRTAPLRALEAVHAADEYSI
jgi:hypothetical protein